MGLFWTIKRIWNKIREKTDQNPYNNNLDLMKQLNAYLENFAEIGDLSSDNNFSGLLSKGVGRLAKATFKGEQIELADLKLADTEKPAENPEGANNPAIQLTGTENDLDHIIETHLIQSQSRVSDEQALEQAKKMKISFISSMLGLEAMGVIAEIASLGQVESVLEVIRDGISMTGLPEVVKELFKIPLVKSVLIPYEQYYNMVYTPYFPSVSELVRMRVREAIDELEYFKALKYQGFEEKWAKAWWHSHWIMPPNRDLFEMFYRGLIDMETLRKQIIINDYYPEFVDKYIEIAYKLPTRMDLRLMSQRIRLDPEKVDEVIKAEGLREDWVKPYRETVLNYRLGDLHSRLANEGRQQFKDGFLTLEEYKKILEEALYSEKEQEAMIRIAELEKRYEYIKDIYTIVKNEFKHGRITIDDFIEILTSNGVTEEKAQILADIEMSKLKVTPEEVTEEEQEVTEE